MLKYMASAIGGLIFFVALIAGVAHFAPTTAYDQAAAVYYVKMDAGHGSAVYIGNGQFVTAAHVAAGAGESQRLLISSGASALEPMMPVKVTWMDADKDVALLTLVDASQQSNLATPAHLACGKADPTVGRHVHAIGFPLNLGKVETWGKVSQNTGPRPDGQINLLADMTVAPGNSGGPAYDFDGDVAGIVVAIPLAPIGPMSATLIPLTYIVPRSVICERMNVNTLNAKN